MEIDGETGNAMETETSTLETSSIKRFGIKNSIQTNFGDDYVFQIASNKDVSALAVSLSSNLIKLYSPETGQYLGECSGHLGTIHEVEFAIGDSPNVVCSCSSDGSVRAWDTRTFKQVSSLRAGSNQEIFSFCFGGSSSNLLVGGCNAQILFWDWRNGKQVANLEESHMEDVTQVQFVPDQPNKLISSSVDGLMCLFDTDGQIDEDNHLESVMNVGTSIAKFGFFGQMNQKLWCLTHIETLSIWDWKDTRRDVNFEDTRSLASNKWNLDNIDYFVDCHYGTNDDRLWVIGGTGSGTLGYFPVDYHNNDYCSTSLGSPAAILEGGHSGIVRTVLPISNFNTGNFAINKRGIFGWTGGEDGRLCCWLSDESTQANHRSWVTSDLVAKSSRIQGKKRHSPY